VAEQAASVQLSRVAVCKGLAALVGISGQKARIANFLFALQKFRDKVERASAAPEANP
jgi:hypothetical protein